MKIFVLAAAFAFALAAGATAQTPPRDEPFGKPTGNAGDSMHQPSSAAPTSRHAASIPPRDEPFGKQMGNDTRETESSAVAHNYNPSDIIPERDEPYGKKMGN